MADPYRRIQPDRAPSATELASRLGFGAGAAAAGWSLVLRALAQVLYAFEVGIGGPSFVLWIEGAASLLALRGALLLLTTRSSRVVVGGLLVVDLLSLCPILIETESVVSSTAFGVHLLASALSTLALVGVFVVARVPRKLHPVSIVGFAPLAPLVLAYAGFTELEPVSERWLLGALVLVLVGIGITLAWEADQQRVTFLERWLDRSRTPVRHFAVLLGFGSGRASVVTPEGSARDFGDVVDAAEWLRARDYVEAE